MMSLLNTSVEIAGKQSPQKAEITGYLTKKQETKGARRVGRLSQPVSSRKNNQRNARSMQTP